MLDCSVAIPPVRDDLAVCPAEAIGKSIPLEKVCESLVALKGWMASNPLPSPDIEPADWSRVRAITVCLLPEPAQQGTSKTLQLIVEADVPERPRPFFVTWSDRTKSFKFGATHRGGL